MKPYQPIAIAFALAAMTACDKSASAESQPQTLPERRIGSERQPESKPQTLTEARAGFVTNIVKKQRVGEPVEPPPEQLFTVVHYPSPAGQLAAYISRIPDGKQKQPAIIWLVGGFSSSISSIAWTPGKPSNDQSATTFWRSGIVTMYPSLRGGNDNPGYMESFYGEVDDVLAAADFLSKMPGVDPQRIYLGGHSTGGTLALLAVESSSRFRAVFSLGPVADVTAYGEDLLVFDKNIKEATLRAPIRWMQGITSPTFIFEGSAGRSNIAALRVLATARHSPVVHFEAVEGADHFSEIQKISRLIAAKILADKDPATPISITGEEVKAAR